MGIETVGRWGERERHTIGRGRE
jgi:hypothetical protein